MGSHIYGECNGTVGFDREWPTVASFTTVCMCMMSPKFHIVYCIVFA